MKEVRSNVKIVLNSDETRAIRVLSMADCTGVACMDCPLGLDDGKCLKSAVAGVKANLIFDPYTNESYVER